MEQSPLNITEGKICPNCGTTNQATAKFCGKCRTSFEQTEHFSEDGDHKFDNLVKSSKEKVTKQKVIRSLLIGLYFSLVCGLAPTTPTVSLSENHSINLMWLVYLIPFVVISYFVLDPFLQGNHSFTGPLEKFFGPKRSIKRRLIYTVIAVTLPFLLNTVSLVLLSPETVIYISIIMGLFFYYLLGYVENWSETGNTSFFLFDNQADKVSEVYKRILERVDQRRLQAEIEFVEFAEKSYLSFIGTQKTKQVEFTLNSGRVILRVREYGSDLYVRWESYLDLSGRRLTLLIGLMVSIINGFLIRWFGTDLFTIFMMLRNILFDQGGKQSTGGRSLYSTQGAMPGIVNWNNLPSSMLDDIFSLEEIVTHSVEEVLNEIRREAKLEVPKIEMGIERNYSNHQMRRAF